MNPAEIIRKARKEKHITQQKLADMAGLSVMSIRRYESRNAATRRIPNIDECRKLAEVLDLQWWELLGLEDYGNGVYAHEMEPEKAEEWKKRLALDNSNESALLAAFRALNAEGKRECIKRVQELVRLEEYRG